MEKGIVKYIIVVIIIIISSIIITNWKGRT